MKLLISFFVDAPLSSRLDMMHELCHISSFDTIWFVEYNKTLFSRMNLQVKEALLEKCVELEQTAKDQATDNAILDQLRKVFNFNTRISIGGNFTHLIMNGSIRCMLYLKWVNIGSNGLNVLKVPQSVSIA